MILYLLARRREVLTWSSQLTYERLRVYEEAIYQVNRIHGIWGFIDGTFPGYCRPTGNEALRRVYSGHKKHHNNNYQVIVTLDGLAVAIAGPFTGPTND